MEICLVGNGQLGSAIASRITKMKDVQLHIIDLKQNLLPEEPELHVDYLVICVPVNDSIPLEEAEFEFHAMVERKIKWANPKVVIIHSTITMNLAQKYQTEEIPMVHVPLRGSHWDLPNEIAEDPLFIGKNNAITDVHILNLNKYFSKMKMFIGQIGTMLETTMAKIVSVCWFGWNLHFTQIIDKLCKKYKLDFEKVYTRYAMSDRVGDHYHKTESGKVVPNNMVSRPVFYPGKIGGNCVIQDEKILQQYLPLHLAEFIDYLLTINDEYAE